MTSLLFLSGTNMKGVLAAEEPVYQWQRLHFSTDSGTSLLDSVLLADGPTHGFYLETSRISLKTKDGESAWVPFGEEGKFEYKFHSIIRGNEGTVAGEPANLSYTSDAGKTWRLIPFSTQLSDDTVSPNYASSSRFSSKGDRPRFFDTKAKSICWDKAETVPGRHPDRWRQDAAGNILFKRFHNCQGCLCFQYDHIVPFSKGGLSVVENCQILQTRVNRLKSNKEDIIANQLKGYSCDVRFNDTQLDLIEISFYGDIIRPGNECRVRSIDESRGNHKSERMAACKLPQDNKFSFPWASWCKVLGF